MKKAALPLALILVAMSLVLWMRGSGSPRASVTTPEGPSAGEREVAELDPPARPEAEAAAKPARSVARIPATEAVPETAPDPDPDEVEIHGTLVVIDEHGGEHSELDGSLKLIAWRSSGGSVVVVEVVKGAFEVAVARGVELGVADIVAGGRTAVLEDERARYPLPEDGVLELTAVWMRSTLVFVRDAETRAELNDVTVVRAESWPRGEYPHPGDVTPERVVLEGVGSPFEIPASDQRRGVFHVKGPGHEWGRLEVDEALGGERTVLLGPGGDLDVELVGGTLDPGLELRIGERGARPTAGVDVKGRHFFSLEGLPVGPFDVSAEIGHWWEDPIVAGKGEVEIRADERAQLRLDLEPTRAAPAVPFAGEIALPTAWELDRFMLVAKLLDPPLGGREEVVRVGSYAMTRAGEGEPEGIELWRWSLDDMQAGRYELELFPLYFSISLEIDAAGNEGVRFEIPPPTEVAVRVLEADTGLPAEIDRLLWNGPRPEWVRGGGCGRAELDPETGLWRFRAARGEVEVHTIGAGYRQARDAFPIGPGETELTLRVERTYGIVLKLLDGQTPVPWPRELFMQLEPASGGKTLPTYGGGSLLYTIHVSEPGLYRLTIPEIPGYEPVPVQELQIGESSEENVISLVRRP